MTAAHSLLQICITIQDRSRRMPHCKACRARPSPTQRCREGRRRQNRQDAQGVCGRVAVSLESSSVRRLRDECASLNSSYKQHHYARLYRT